jgi:Pilus formation protein N terminal region
MIKQRAQSGYRRGTAQSVYSTLAFVLFLLMSSVSFGGQLTVEQLSKQPIVLTQGFSTTIHSDRPFGKISITNPEVVDLVLRTDKSAVLIPQRLGRTNVDFLDDQGSVISSVQVVVVRQSTSDRSLFMIIRLWGPFPPTIAGRADANTSMKYRPKSKRWRLASPRTAVRPDFPGTTVRSARLLNEPGIAGGPAD